MLKVSKTALLFIAGIVWLAAGVNIARLGILSFSQMSQSMWWMLVIGAIAVFTVFHIKVFSKMVGKHANRIAGYVEDKIAFWRFFDASSYIMMAIMMTGGISPSCLRSGAELVHRLLLHGPRHCLGAFGHEFPGPLRSTRQSARSLPCPLPLLLSRLSLRLEPAKCS